MDKSDYTNNLITDKKKWIERAEFILHLQEFQKTKKGETRVGAYGGWGNRDTQELLGEKSVSTINNFINLALKFKNYPKLKEFPSRTKAEIYFENRSAIFEKYDDEDDLEIYLQNNWNSTPFSEEWELKESQVNVGYKKRMDMLAYHRTESCWLVVELKRDKGYKETVGQILRYMGWFKENRARKDEKIKGLIITSWPVNTDISYALLYAPDVDQQVYYLLYGKPEFNTIEGMEILEADVLEQLR